MTIKTWPALAELVQALEKEDPRGLKPAVFDALADRLEAALAAGDNQALEEASKNLEDIARQWMAAGSDAARKAMRGDHDSDPQLTSLVIAGRLAFAQTLASRVLDKRADDTFYAIFTDGRYQPYVCALMSGPKSGRELADMVEETEETVSRKLKILERQGVVRRRKNGQVTINLLTPAARQFADAKRLAPAGARVVAPQVQDALSARSTDLGDYLQSSPVLGDAEHHLASAR